MTLRAGGHPLGTCRLSATILAAALLATACDGGGGASQDVGAAATAEPTVEVSVTPVRRGAVSQSISAPGSLVARRESRIGVQVKGRIERIFVDEGDRVVEGDTLFQIDRNLYGVAVAESEAGLRLAVAERRQAQSDLGRARKLRGQQVLSEQDLSRLETSLEVARAREEQAEHALEHARHNLERTLVLAPYSGSIFQRLEDEGTTALVQPQTIVLVLQETTELEARVPIPESQLSDVEIGDRALIHIDGAPQPIHSEIASVGDSIDPATRTYLVTTRVPNPDHRLKAGVFAHVEIFPEEKRDVLLVPRESIRREEGRTRVLAVRDGRAEAVLVQLGVASKDDAELLEGLAEGDLVIVGEAARRIAPGMRVTTSDSEGGGSGAR